MMKQRAFLLLKNVLLVLMVGFLYVAVIKLFHIGIPCPFRELTGFKCPGCGISTMFLALLQFDFTAAFEANRVLLFLLPVFMGLFVKMAVNYIKTGSMEQGRVERWICIVVLVVLLLFGILRNLPGITW